MAWEVSADLTPLRKNLAVAKSEVAVAGGSMAKAGGATQLLQRDIKGLSRDTATAVPGLGGFGNSLMGIPMPALAAAAALGGLVIAGKSIVDISDKWEASQKGLKQATDATGTSYADAKAEVDDFIAHNRKFIPNQAEVVDSFAALTRQLGPTGRVTQDLNLALDLAAIKHISLKDATTALQQAEAGRGRALLTLGIQMKDYPVLMESQHTADMKLAAAEKAVEKATAAHTAAVKKHGAQSAQARAAAVLLADANAKLAEAHNYAKERAAASAEIHDLLAKKLKGGRDTTSDLTQVQNQLSNVWQTFAEKTGPALTNMLVQAEKVLVVVVSAVVDGITTMTSWKGLWDVVGKIIGVAAAIIKEEFVVAITIARTEINLIIDVVKILWQAFQDVVSAVKDVINFLGRIKVPSISLPFGIGGPSGSQHRAFGGPVVPGQIYQVNENTPNSEWFAPSVPGTIIPHGGAGAGGQVTVHVHGFVGDPQQLFQVFREGIRRLDRAQS
jgi:hypothetical protein